MAKVSTCIVSKSRDYALSAVFHFFLHVANEQLVQCLGHVFHVGNIPSYSFGSRHKSDVLHKPLPE